MLFDNNELTALLILQIPDCFAGILASQSGRGVQWKGNLTHFDKVERLWLVLLREGDGTQHSVDVRQSPHRGAQQGGSGVDAGP